MADYIHFWKIESPNSPVSRGVCRKCGEERVWPNSFESSSAFHPLPPAPRGRRKRTGKWSQKRMPDMVISEKWAGQQQ